MKIYKILACINYILLTIRYIKGKMVNGNLEFLIGETGYTYVIINILLVISFPIDVILFIIGI